MSFSMRLADAVVAKRTPLVVGLDPRVSDLPAEFSAATHSREEAAEAFEHFCRGVIDVVAPLVPAVKPQAAFFEQLGPDGMNALAGIIAYARERGLLVIADAKRGDIGSTAAAYAAGWLGVESPFGGDALTANPYLGDDSLEPCIERAKAAEAGLFVLVKTSNPGGGQWQDLLVDGRPLHERVALAVQGHAAESADASGYGAVGAVVGATYPEQLARLRGLMPSAWILVPGFGAQGGSATDVAAAFDDRGLGAVVNSARAIIFAERRGPHAGKPWQSAIESAALDAVAALRDATPAGKLEVFPAS